MTDRKPRPELSVVVVVYNIPHEARRTLESLAAGYQRGIPAEDYEVVVVDSGSEPPVDRALFEGLSGTFRLVRIEDSRPSPAHAANLGLAEARGEIIGVMIDGARMVTPGLLHFARHGTGLYDRAVVATLGWCLGFDSRQRWAVDTGYTREQEDRLLQSIAWPQDGYRLFDIAAPDSSTSDGWFAPIAESAALFQRRHAWTELQGYDERFDLPGGGLVNLDMFRRSVEAPGAQLVVLLGEGAFHQLHEGAASGAPIGTFPDLFQQWAEQYATLAGRRWESPQPEPRSFLGILPDSLRRHLVRATVSPARTTPSAGHPRSPAAGDLLTWCVEPAQDPKDPTIARLAELARAEVRAGRLDAAAAVARIARSRAPKEEALLHLLASASPYFPGREPEPPGRAGVAVARGDAYRLLGDLEHAEVEYRTALELERGLVRAHLGLASLRMPGEDYRAWLKWLHTLLRPATYVEIGVAAGDTLSLAEPPTVAIGVDPHPSAASALRAETHLFCETSDDFFARRGLDGLLRGQAVSLAFIDGLHHFDQALRDFNHMEAYCRGTSLVVLHDTVPLDDLTQSREQHTQFWTGDVWRLVLCLKHYRPDLDVFTVATGPTGLTHVTGLDPSSRELKDAYEEAVARFAAVPFVEVKGRLSEAVSLVPNDREAVAARLKARGVLV